MGRLKHGSASLPTPLVLVLCLACFLGGHFLLPRLVDSSDDDKPGRRSALELQQKPDQLGAESQQLGAGAAETARVAAPRGRPVDFEAAVAAAGLLKDRPPLQPGDGGRSGYLVQPMQMLSWYPRTYLFPRFMDDDRANHIVRIAEKRLAPSGLAYRRGDSEKNSRDVRTSQGTFMSRDMDPDGVLAWVEDKISVLTGIPTYHGEAFNVLRYESGQHYDSHYDVFDPESYGPQSSQRIATVLFYLTDVMEGGETIFPLESAGGLARLETINYRNCDRGFKYQPRKGDAVLFYSTHPNGTFDKHALHGGCPVRGTKDQKFVATKWLRDKGSD